MNFLAPITPEGSRFYSHFQSMVLESFSQNNLLIVVCTLVFCYVLAKHYDFKKLERVSCSAIRNAAIVLLLVLFGVSISKTGGVPHFEDEFCNLYQSQAISNLQYPGVKIKDEYAHTFETNFLKIRPSDNRLVSVYSPGFPFFLSLLQLVVPQNGLSSVIFIINLILFSIYIRGFAKESQNYAWMLLASASFFVIHSIFLFSQTLSLSIVLILLIRAKNKLPGWLDFGLVLLLWFSRPMDGLILFLWLLYRGAAVKAHLKYYSTWIFFVCIAASGHLYHNRVLSGDCFVSGYSLFAPHFKYGYGADVGMAVPYGFNIYQAFTNFFVSFLSLNNWLFGWPLIGFVFLFSILFKKSRQQWVFAEVLLLCLWLFFYFHYFFPSMVAGPRFYVPLLPLLIKVVCENCTSNFFRALTLTLVVFGCINIVSTPLRNSAGVISNPHFAKDDNTELYIVKEQTFGGKPLMYSYRRYNDPFNSNTPKIVSEVDLKKNINYFLKKYNKVKFLQLKPQNLSTSGNSRFKSK
jgi:hypothetical protein